MFGSPERFSPDSYAALFMTLYDPAAKRVARTKGHIDFVNKPIPALGRGFVTQIALLDRESFGGNITIWPGTHKLVQKAVIDDPEWRFPTNWDDIPQGEPFEFVAEAGDALLFHHLVAHGGNPNCTRMPRLNLHCQCWQHEWLTEIDPAKPVSPWERSLALNGYHAIHANEQAMREAEQARRRELSVSV
jgi:ectoine hydroxylase-related dioxygenase (phytanoyl-CoA dioxygenase family)